MTHRKSPLSLQALAASAFSDVRACVCEWAENCGGRIGNGLNHFHTEVQEDLELFCVCARERVCACVYVHGAEAGDERWKR